MRVSRPLLSLAVVCAAAVTTFGQTTGSATLRGRVTDPTGAVIPKIEVTLTNEASKDERKGRTNDEGIFVFSSLIPSTYTEKSKRADLRPTARPTLF
jgi:protocatechuate 3,4-dioxygenase beta subunit